MATAGGSTTVPMYAFSGTIANMFSMDCSQGVGCDLRGQGIILLIGRDLLQHVVVTYDGTIGLFTIAS